MTTSTRPTAIPSDPTRRHVDTARLVAAAAALVAAGLYLLIGLGVLDIGESTQAAAATDLFAFGAMMAATFAVVAALLWRLRSALLWAAVAVLQVIVLVGYVAFANVRDPAFDPWGILIKICQAIVLVAMAYLLVRGREPATAARTPATPKGHAA